jgi:hypothetical protein
MIKLFIKYWPIKDDRLRKSLHRFAVCITIIIFILYALLSHGCSGPETVIKDRRIEISIPAIKDSLPAEYKNIPQSTTDSLDKIFSTLPDTARIEASKDLQVKSKNLRVSIKYYPKKKSFELDIPEQKADTTITDTTKITVNKETTTAEKFGYGTIGIIIFIIIAVFVFLTIKFKWITF